MTKSATDDVLGGEVVPWLQNTDGLNCACAGQPQTLTLTLTNGTDVPVQLAASGDTAATITVDLSKLGTVTLSLDAVACPGLGVRSWENGVLTLAVPSGTVTWLRGATLSIALGSVTIDGPVGALAYSVTFAGVSAAFDHTVPATFVVMRGAAAGSASAPSVAWTQRNRLSGSSGKQPGRQQSLEFQVTALPAPAGAPAPSVPTPTILVMTVGSRVKGRTPLLGIAGMKVEVEGNASINAGTETSPLWRVTVPAERFTRDGGGLPVALTVSLTEITPIRPSGSGSLVVYTLGFPGCNDGFAVLTTRVDNNPVVITDFDVTPTSVDGLAGPAAVTLTWNVEHAALVTLSGVGVVPADGRSGYRTTIDDTTSFILTAFGDGFASMDAKARTVAVTPDLQTRLVPPGTIMIWKGARGDIPQGWYACDGDNGTPDLRDRFILGAGAAANPNDKGAGDGHAHGVSALDGNFSFDTSTNGDHTHGMPTNWFARNLSCGKWAGIDAGGPYNPNTQSQSGGGHHHSVSVTFKEVVTDGVGPVRPPWYALFYIMKS